MVLALTIDGLVKGKGRPKFSTFGGFAKAYTPKGTVEYENWVRLCWAQYCEKNGEVKLSGNIGVVITAYFPIPKSVSKKKRAELNLAPYPKKPDCDNIAKSILDALNGRAYDDDSQITTLRVEKVYSEKPQAIVTMWEVGKEPPCTLSST